MHIQVDGSESGAELFHLSVLFQSLAKELGYVVPKTGNKLEDFTVKLDIDTTDATAALDKLVAHAAMTPTDHFQSCVKSGAVTFVETPAQTAAIDELLANPLSGIKIVDVDGNVESFTPPATNDKLDADGLPWDARIHSGSRERNANGKWRTARKPKALTEEQWQETLTRVNAELRDLMEIPVSPGAVADAAAEEALTDAEVEEFEAIIDDLTAEPVSALDEALDIIANIALPVTIAPPVVVPPVTAVAPPITVDKPAIETFAQLMSWLTSRTPKDEAAKPAMVTRVNEILAANGLTTLQQLGQRADLIPQVLVQFREAFGE